LHSHKFISTTKTFNYNQHIEMRMPLHMHARLRALYVTWVTYWAEVNWCERVMGPGMKSQYQVRERDERIM